MWVVGCTAGVDDYPYDSTDSYTSQSYDLNYSYDSTDSYTSQSYDLAHGSFSTQQTCADKYRGDQECDVECNVVEHGYDDGDCFHDDPGCYVYAAGDDYRGGVNFTKLGYPCQLWSAQYPRPHTYIVAHYPDANLGGHNHCRNPSSNEGSAGPWCLIDSDNDYVPIWDYCDVGPPSLTPCTAPNPLAPKTSKQLQLNHWHSDSVYENRYMYYNLSLPPQLAGFQAVVVPISGLPALYVSFDEPFPTGHSAQYRQDTAGVEVFYMTSETYGYCSHMKGPVRGPASAEDGKEEDGKDGCTLYLSVSAQETSEFQIIVYDTAGSTACTAGCTWSRLGDGECTPECSSEACFSDLGDCSRGNLTPVVKELWWSTGMHCHAACKEEWIDDGYCDAVCFNSLCSFDGEDCGGKGCSDGCMKRHRGNGVCDAACNVEACNWDSGDCFHRHSGCYTETKGQDYRGTVSHTSSGKVCQRWSEQAPNVHQFDHHKWPHAGVGGHRFCRNPDASELHPWCYVDSEGGPRFELCDVGAPSETPCPLPPPPSPRMPRHSHVLDTRADALISLVIPEDAGRAEALGVGVLIGGSLACLVALAALVALWKHLGLLAKSGVYSFAAPPSAEEEDNDE